MIYRTPCPKNATCANQFVINKVFYQAPGPIPKQTIGQVRSTPLETARKLGLSRAMALETEVLALRVGPTWELAFGPANPGDAAKDRQLCSLTENLRPDDPCVTKFGSPATTS